MSGADYRIASPYERRPVGPICLCLVGGACPVHPLHEFVVSNGTGSDYKRGYDAGFADGFEAAMRYSAPDPRGGAR
jgi:hypothetical protein